MTGIRVIAGSLKGRAIRLPARWHEHSEATPQKVKGALFSSLGENLDGSSFLDLFAGSGQIGIEALSRGARPVVINECDRAKYAGISAFITGLPPGDRPVLMNLSATRAIQKLAAEGFRFDVVFLDPPYEKKKGPMTVYAPLLGEITQLGLLAPEGTVVVQHFAANEIDCAAIGLVLSATKHYGTSALSFYRDSRDYS